MFLYYTPLRCTMAGKLYHNRDWLYEEYITKEYPKAQIVRTQWLYGPGGPNFVQTMLRLAKTRNALSIVSDQFGTPTYTRHLASALHSLSQKEHSGIFHIRSSGFASWFQFAETIFQYCNQRPELSPIPSKDFPRPAPRPKNSRLEMKRWEQELKLPSLPHWKEGLREYLSQTLQTSVL